MCCKRLWQCHGCQCRQVVLSISQTALLGYCMQAVSKVYTVILSQTSWTHVWDSTRQALSNSIKWTSDEGVFLDRMVFIHPCSTAAETCTSSSKDQELSTFCFFFLLFVSVCRFCVHTTSMYTFFIMISPLYLSLPWNLMEISSIIENNR